MDFGKYSIEELKNMQIRIAEEIENRKSAEKKNVLDEIAALAAAKGFSLEELVGPGRKVGGATRKGGKVLPKYRHPDDANITWTGRGRKPAWIAEWLSQGKSLDKLSVK